MLLILRESVVYVFQRHLILAFHFEWILLLWKEPPVKEILVFR